MSLLSLLMQENESGVLQRVICHLESMEGGLEVKDRELLAGPAGKLF